MKGPTELFHPPTRMHTHSHTHKMSCWVETDKANKDQERREEFYGCREENENKTKLLPVYYYTNKQTQTSYEIRILQELKMRVLILDFYITQFHDFHILPRCF